MLIYFHHQPSHIFCLSHVIHSISFSWPVVSNSMTAAARIRRIRIYIYYIILYFILLYYIIWLYSVAAVACFEDYIIIFYCINFLRCTQDPCPLPWSCCCPSPLGSAWLSGDVRFFWWLRLTLKTHGRLMEDSLNMWHVTCDHVKTMLKDVCQLKYVEICWNPAPLCIRILPPLRLQTCCRPLHRPRAPQTPQTPKAILDRRRPDPGKSRSFEDLGTLARWACMF